MKFEPLPGDQDSGQFLALRYGEQVIFTKIFLLKVLLGFGFGLLILALL
jgi:hypothetical protein